MPVNNTVFKQLALSALACLSLSVVPPGWADTPAAQAEVGKAAPPFSLPNVDGKTVKLSDFHGKVVVLEWFCDKCPFDKKHYVDGNMQALQKQYVGKGVVWLVINSAGQDKPGFHPMNEYPQLMKDWKFNTSYFLQDPSGAVGHLYGAKTTPDMFVIGKDGKILYSGAIDDQPDTDAESNKIAKNYVKAALDQVLAGKPVSEKETKSYG